MSARGGIDLGGTKIQAVVVDDKHEVLGDSRRPTPHEGGPQDVADAMAETVRDAAKAAGLEPGALAGIGVGSPGAVDDGAGTVTSARNLPGWEGSFDLATSLSSALGPIVRLGNDVQVATDAEFALGAADPGAPEDAEQRARVLGGAAGEIGHMVVRRGGAHCTCGRRGCMEAYAGRAAMEITARHKHEDGAKTDLFKIMEKRGRDRLTSGIWARALKREDKLATSLIERAVRALGAGVASAVNLLDVETVVIGGGMGVRLGEPYVEKIAAAMTPHLFSADRPPAISVAHLGDLGGAIGASLLVDRS